jgi:spore maturation protein CgeB
VKIVYSYNKTGYDATVWEREIAAASTEAVEFLPFNHQRYLSPQSYLRAQQLDDLYWAKSPALLRLYSDLEALISRSKADALLVTNCPPYHPEFLLRLPIYRILYNTDDPVSTYDRNLPYLHAYHHVFYYNPYYRPQRDMARLLADCGVRNADYLPLGVFDAMYDGGKSEDELIQQRRDIDLIYIGAAHLSKLATLAAIKRRYRARFRLHGWFTWKKNVYFNLRYGFPGWIWAAKRRSYVPLYQRSKIGINLGDPGIYGIANYRLYDVPANGVMLICQGGEAINRFYQVGEEIVAYDSVPELLEKVDYYLAHDDERRKIALAGHRRVVQSYRFGNLTRTMGPMIEKGMKGIAYVPQR